VGKKASSFAIFGLRVGFARIANVLGLVRRLARNLQFAYCIYQLIFRFPQFVICKSQLTF